ncbi:hypothetical protein HYW21_00470 [Candidatus Woesearchaeota archaeon]|nr:hypothetical protein [Candidatus Woesearchaeota archaeon]
MNDKRWVLYIVVFLLCLGTVSAYGSCDPSLCPPGWHQEGNVDCSGQYCTRYCYRDSCGSWNEVYNHGEFLPDNDETGSIANLEGHEYKKNALGGMAGFAFPIGSYAPPNPNNCYRFRFLSMNGIVDSSDIDYEDTGEEDSSMSIYWESNTDWQNNARYYCDSQEYSEAAYVDFDLDNGDDFDSADDLAGSPNDQNYWLFCAPNQEACDSVSSYCDTDCYNVNTKLKIEADCGMEDGFSSHEFNDFCDIDDWSRSECEIDYVNFDDVYVYMYVYEAPIVKSYNNQQCLRPECDSGSCCDAGTKKYKANGTYCGSLYDLRCDNPNSCSGSAKQPICSGNSENCYTSNYLTIGYPSECYGRSCSMATCGECNQYGSCIAHPEGIECYTDNDCDDGDPYTMDDCINPGQCWSAYCTSYTWCGNRRCDFGENAEICPKDCSAQCGDGFCTHNETPLTCLRDCPTTCGDTYCAGQENAQNCEVDCPPRCGDTYCTHNENPVTCPQDCPTTCGDRFCTGWENAQNCEQDCPAICGDTFCTHNENAYTCPEDCLAFCGDEYCTSGESFCNCEQDCSPSCGDGCCSLDAGESCSTCFQECGFCNSSIQYNLSYDENGNLVQGVDFYYEYNGFNQLRRLREGNGSGRILAEYSYGPADERVKKVEYDTFGNNKTTYYVNDNYLEVHDRDSIFREVYFKDRNGVILAKQDDVGLYHFHPDHLGSTVLVTDEAGNVVSETSYLPFGLVIDGGDERNLFTGKELERETAMYYYGARYYDAFLRRFTQPDTVFSDVYNPQALNRYSYVLNNPMKYTDPDGNTPWDVVDVGFMLLDAKTFKKDPTLANAAWLTLSVVSLAPVLPNILGYGHHADDAVQYSDEALEAGGKFFTRMERVGVAQKAVSNMDRLNHGWSKHAKQLGLKQFKGGSWKAERQAWKEFNQNVIETGKAFEGHKLGGEAVTGYYKVVDGKDIVTFVFTEGPNKGLIATTIKASDDKLIKWGLK